MIDSKTRLTGLVGYPLGHSLSPQINNIIAGYTGINVSYLCFETKKDELFRNIKALVYLGAPGFNVTIPHKSEIMLYIDRADPLSGRINAVNTVKIKDKEILGFNTDVEGFSRAFSYDTDTELTGKKVVVLGAGGASNAVIYSVMLNEPSSLYILNRTQEKAQASAEIFAADGYGPLDDSMASLLYEADVIINTTSAGMHPDSLNDPLDFFDEYRTGQIVYDIIYNPPVTKLMNKAEQAGSKTGNGLSMLIFQAIRSFEIINDIIINDNDLQKIIKQIKNSLPGELVWK